jgi:hypothetical protein
MSAHSGNQISAGMGMTLARYFPDDHPLDRRADRAYYER